MSWFVNYYSYNLKNAYLIKYLETAAFVLLIQKIFKQNPNMSINILGIFYGEEFFAYVFRKKISLTNKKIAFPSIKSCIKCRKLPNLLAQTYDSRKKL